VAVSFCKLRVSDSLSRQRSRVRAPSSPPHFPKDLRNVWTYSDKRIWVRYGCNKNLIEQFEGVLHPFLHPDFESSILRHIAVDGARVFPADVSPVGSVKAIGGRARHIWVGGDSGLAFFDGNRFRRIDPADAEAFGSVVGVEETADGSLWLAESRGVIQVPASEVQQALDNPSYRVKYRRLFR
jgi:hypothetical protein